MNKVFGLTVALLMVASVSSAQLLKPGDMYVGGKIALGAIGGANLGFIANGEYGLQDDIGVGGVLAYSSYSQDFGLYEYSYTNLMILGSVTYHYDLLKDSKIDTFGAFNVGLNVGSSTGKWKLASNLPVPSVSHGGLVWGFSANGRYFLTNKLALTASVGIGLGILNIGIDYKL